MNIGQGLSRARSALASRPAEAVQRATRLIDQAGKTGQAGSAAEAHLLNVEALLQLNRLAEAHAALDRAFEVARNQSPCIQLARMHAMHARLLLQEGRTTLAMAAVNRALAMPALATSERADLYTMVAYCHGRLHHLDAAAHVMREHVLPLSIASGDGAAIFIASARMAGLLHVYACAALDIPHSSLRKMKRPAKADATLLLDEAEKYLGICDAHRASAAVGDKCYGYAMEGLIRSLGVGLHAGLPCFETGLGIAGSGFPRARMHLCYAFGVALRIEGRFGEAVTRFEDAGAIATATNDRRHQRLLRYELALCARSKSCLSVGPLAPRPCAAETRDSNHQATADGQSPSHHAPNEPRSALPAGADHSLPTAIEVAEDFIDRNLQRRLHVVEIARVCGVSVRKLQQLYQQYRGRHISDVVRERRMSFARHLLEDQHLSVSDVADKLGYSSPANFSRDFKQHVGLAASEARWRDAAPPRG